MARPGSKLTHLNPKGEARMVDVSAKPPTLREATASARVFMQSGTLALISEGRIEKGDVLAASRIAGIMAAKRTPELIPLCHQIALSSVQVDLAINAPDSTVEITATARTTGPTGVEMEALTAAAVAALTVYDMCKAADRGMRVSDVMLLEKSGGRSGRWKRKG